MKSAGLLLPLILATTLLAAEPANTPVPAESAKVPVPLPAPAGTTGAVPVPSAAPTSDAIPKPTGQISPEVSQMLTANLPKYSPAPAATPKPTVDEPSADAIELPKVIVKQKKRPRLGDEVMMTNKAFNEKLAKEKTSSFDRDFLNKYGFLGGASAAERARDEYDRAQRDQMAKDVSVMAKALEQEDPAAAKALRDTANKQ